jgi:diguanylate cyclase (GGDEF)-like protein
MASEDVTTISFTRLQERAEYLERLMRSIWDLLFVSEEIVKTYSFQAAEIDIEGLIRSSMEGLKNFLPTTGITFYRVNEESFEFEQYVTCPESYAAECAAEVDAMISNGQFGWGIRQQEIATFKSTVLPPDLVKSIYFVPMISGQNLMGALLIFSPGEAEELNREVFRIIELVCRQMCFTIENTTLYRNLKLEHEKLEKAYDGMDRQMRQLSILYDVGNALHLIDDLTKLLIHILTQATGLNDSKEGALLLHDDKTDELVVRLVRNGDRNIGEDMQQGEKSRISVARDTLPWRVFESGEPLILDELSPAFPYEKLSFMPSPRVLAVPLKIYGECLGVIAIANTQEGRKYSSEDVKVLSALASQAASAIDNSKLYNMAVTDSLSKLYTRRFLMQRLNEEIQRARRYGHDLSLLMMDIDHFKEFNDTYGHQAGDAIIVEVARIFRRCTRTTDVPGRYGGEEFCIILPETPAQGACVVADRLRAEVEQFSIGYMGQSLRSTISIGIAAYPLHADSMEELIRKADRALYRAKEEGRNRVSVSDADPQDPSTAP